MQRAGCRQRSAYFCSCYGVSRGGGGDSSGGGGDSSISPRR